MVENSEDTAEQTDSSSVEPESVEPESVETTEDGTGPGEPRSRRTLFRWAAAAAVLVIVVVLVGAVVVLGTKVKSANDIDAAASQALDTASAYAVTLTSVDPDKLDENFAAVLAGATGDFKKMYSDSSAQLRQVLIDNKATGTGTVVQAGIKSATTQEVQVLLFVDQTVSNTSSPEPRVDRSRILMTLDNVDGAWLVSNVELP